MEDHGSSTSVPSVRDSVLSVSLRPNILVIRRRYLGDLVLLGSVFRNLKLHWPAARLTVLVEPAYAGVLPLQPDVDATLTFPHGAWGWPGFARALRAGRFTHVLDFDNTDRTALATRLTGAGVRATFDRELIPFKYRRVYTHTAKVANRDYDRQHVTETYLRLPAALGVPVASRDIRLKPREEDLVFARDLLQSKIQNPKSKMLLIHPGSRSQFRLWPPDRFGRVCDRIYSELKARVVLLAGPGEEDLVSQILQQARSEPDAIRAALPIPQLAALMNLFPVMLCHDSGPMHLAAGVGVRVVGLYGSQNAAIWRPLGGQHTVLQTALPCSCLLDTPQPCVKTDSYRSYCVRKLEVDEVFAAVAAAMRS